MNLFLIEDSWFVMLCWLLPMKIETTMGYHLTPVRMAVLKKKKNLQTLNAGEGVEKREPSWTVVGNVR